MQLLTMATHNLRRHLTITLELVNLRPAAQPLHTLLELEYNSCASRGITVPTTYYPFK